MKRIENNLEEQKKQQGENADQKTGQLLTKFSD